MEVYPLDTPCIFLLQLLYHFVTATFNQCDKKNEFM